MRFQAFHGSKRCAAPRLVRIADIQRCVAIHYGLSVEAVGGRSRELDTLAARRVAITLARQAGFRLKVIVHAFGGLDQSTAYRARRATLAREKDDPAFAGELALMRRVLARYAGQSTAGGIAP